MFLPGWRNSARRGEDVDGEGGGYVAFYLLGQLAVDPDFYAAGAGYVEGGVFGDGGDVEVGAEVVGLDLSGAGGEGVFDLCIARGVVGGPDVFLGDGGVAGALEDGIGEVAGGIKGGDLAHGHGLG